jgi:predicted RNA binding protein YcfA (HicA-like mRNA interferase family)
LSAWPSTKARRVLRALKSIGWQEKGQSGSHKTLIRAGWDNHTFAWGDDDEIGPKMLAKIAKRTGLKPADL